MILEFLAFYVMITKLPKIVLGTHLTVYIVTKGPREAELYLSL